ncbi:MULTISPECIES: lipopolysaccharide biosynthesis protein [Pseudomonas]|uniref:Oligosaccharide flippase family protein n=1 Tax=Pseudomonas helleri TaxID=1608996 RepID=A0A7X1WW51_9PSED|nr:oligosaccharide flippase family protein [Pseudomonas helleri]MQT75613.1 oligosaccharide flippase family protein [Pseudomonas helleri]
MLNYVNRLTKSGFVRNVAIVATGTAGAQAIAIAFAPIITRMYGPEVFGSMGTFIAILEIISPFAALSYPIAMVLPKNDSDAIALGKLSLSIALFTSLITAMILALFKEPIVNTFNLQMIEPYLILLPLTMFFSVSMAVAGQWTIRKKLFKLKARAAILQSLLVNTAKSGLGIINPTAIILIGMTSLGYLIHTLLLWAGIKLANKETTYPDEHQYLPQNKYKLFEQLKIYKEFAYFRTPQIFLSSIGQSLPILMLANLFTPAAVGFYILARTVLFVPSNLIGSSVADVFYPKFVETIRNGDSGKNLLLKSCISLASVGAVPYITLIVCGPWLFSLIFGADWKEAGEYARWMSIWLFLVLITRPIIAAIPALSLQGLFLLFEGTALLVRAAAIMVGYFWIGTALSAVIAFSLSNLIIYAVLTIIVIKKA